MPKLVCKTDGRKSDAKGRDFIYNAKELDVFQHTFICLAVHDKFIFTINLPERCFSVFHFAYL